jgi:predicted RecB family nuclease
MTITQNLFQSFLECPTKCWLNFRGEPPTGNAYAEWLQKERKSYRAEAIKRFQEGIPKADSINSPLQESLKSGNWRIAMEVKLESKNLAAQIPILERKLSEGRSKASQLVPISVVLNNKLTRNDKLLLSFDALVLSEMIGREINQGKIMHGDNYTILNVKTSGLAGEVRKHIQKINALLSNSVPPEFVLNRHCAECEFQARCRRKAVEQDELSLLSGMRDKERRKLRNKGIFTVTQLSYTFRPRRRPKKQRDKREKYHHSLKALAIREKKIHLVGSPEFKLEGTPVYLDVEGLPDQDFYYLIGLRIASGTSAIQHTLWADCVQDEGKIWQEFLALLHAVEKPILIHYGSYETTFLKRMSERHGGTPKESPVVKYI